MQPVVIGFQDTIKASSDTLIAGLVAGEVSLLECIVCDYGTRCQNSSVVESPLDLWVGRVAVPVGIDSRQNEEDVVEIGSVAWMPDADTLKPGAVCHGQRRNGLWSSEACSRALRLWRFHMDSVW